MNWSLDDVCVSKKGLGSLGILHIGLIEAFPSAIKQYHEL